MKTRFKITALIALLGLLLLSACGAAPAPTEAPAAEAPAEMYVEAPAATEAPVAMEAPAPAPSEGEAVADASAESGTGVLANDAPNASFAASHMIIKDGQVKLLVEDTDIAINRATQVIGDLGGYIISSRVWYQPYANGENYKYATITIGVPVDQFERALTRLRGLSVKVLDETASGEDVTNQFVDLQSQVTNLEATRDRIKSFLDNAQTVEESLRINQELSNIEAQIEQIKGRMNYLKDRSAYSTLTINLEPVLPELVATPTPTPTPTITPTPKVWKPGETFTSAKTAVTYAYQGIIDFLIWIFVVVIPILAPPVLIVWALLKFFTRKWKKPGQ